jgi:hypothetical protein
MPEVFTGIRIQGYNGTKEKVVSPFRTSYLPVPG